MNLWERSLFFRLSKTAGFLFLSLAFLYVFADLALHSTRFFSKGAFHPGELLLYYVFCISLKLDLFLSLSFLMGLLIVLFDGASHLEFVSLQTAGISKNRIARPFILLATFCCLISYANSEWLATRSFLSIDSFREIHAKRKKRILREHVQGVLLEDGSELVYSRFDTSAKTLYDLYWLCGKHKIWYIKTLDLKETPPAAHFADLLVRTPQKKITVAESFEKRAFPELTLSDEQIQTRFIPYDRRPLSLLLAQSSAKSGDRALIRSHLHHKLSLPLVPLFLTLFLPPLLFRFSRQRAFFIITGASLFCLISLFMIFDGMLIVAESKMLPPALALWAPWLLLFPITIPIRKN